MDNKDPEFVMSYADLMILGTLILVVFASAIRDIGQDNKTRNNMDDIHRNVYKIYGLEERIETLENNLNSNLSRESIER